MCRGAGYGILMQDTRLRTSMRKRGRLVRYGKVTEGNGNICNIMCMEADLEHTEEEERTQQARKRIEQQGDQA